MGKATPLLRELTTDEATILDRLALKWVDDDDAPEQGWVLRGAVDQLEEGGGGPYLVPPLYREEYRLGLAMPLAAAAVLDYVEGDLDEYDLFHFELGHLCDIAQENRDDMEEEARIADAEARDSYRY